MQYYQNKVSGFKMKILVYFIYFLILMCMVESRRQRSIKSRRVRPRGNRHHIFKNVNPTKIQNKSQTTKVTKIVTVNGNGHKTVKKFNEDQNEFYDYPNYDPNSMQHPSPHPNPYPQNPYQKPGSHPPNPGPKPIPGPYPVPMPGPNPGPSPSFNSNFPPNPPSEPHHPVFDISYPPWHVPKYKEYTTECCTTLNVSTSDQSQHITRGIVTQI